MVPRPGHAGTVPSEVAAVAGNLEQQTRELLPAALLLLAFQVLAIVYGFNHLNMVQGAALVGTAGWTGASIVVFVSVLRRVRRPGRLIQPLHEAEVALVSTTSRLLVGATTNIAFGIAVVTGSWVLAAVIAGLLVLLTWWICWVCR